VSRRSCLGYDIKRKSTMGDALDMSLEALSAKSKDDRPKKASTKGAGRGRGGSKGGRGAGRGGGGGGRAASFASAGRGNAGKGASRGSFAARGRGGGGKASGGAVRRERTFNNARNNSSPYGGQVISSRARISSRSPRRCRSDPLFASSQMKIRRTVVLDDDDVEDYDDDMEDDFEEEVPQR
jgi:hypothetical protein